MDQIVKGHGGLCGTLKFLYLVPKVPKIRKRDIYNKQWSTYMMVVNGCRIYNTRDTEKGNRDIFYSNNLYICFINGI